MRSVATMPGASSSIVATIFWTNRYDKRSKNRIDRARMQAHTLQPLGEVGIVSVKISLCLPDEFAISIEGAGEPGEWVHTTCRPGSASQRCVQHSPRKQLESPTRNEFLAREPSLP